MNGPDFLNRISDQISQLVPEPLRDAREELHKNAGAVLQQALSRMDLVSREEFDTQAEVLARTRAKLEALEKKVRELESETSDHSR